MAYIDVLSPNSYISVNKKLIKVLGLKAAAYTSEVLCIMTHVQKKSTLSLDGYFKIDRKYVEDQIGLSLSDQYICDATLEKLLLLREDPTNPDRISVNAAEICAIITESNPESLQALAKKAKVTTVESAAIKRGAAAKKRVLSAEEKSKKIDGMREGFKNVCASIVPSELLDAYCLWVDSVYDIPNGSKGKNFLTRAFIANFYKEVCRYTSDIATHKKIMEIACLVGYPDHPEYTIERYKQDSVRIGQQQRVATSVDMSQGF